MRIITVYVFIFVLALFFATGVIVNASAIPAEEEVLLFDTFTAGNGVVSTAMTLTNGIFYSVIVSGTHSRWDSSLWSQLCTGSGTPESSPERPSPDKLNGQVGVDYEYVWAFPVHPGCLNYPQAPFKEGQMYVSLDNGNTWFDPIPLSPGYNSEHVYQYLFLGEGYPLKLKQTDQPISDNYGVLTFSIAPFVFKDFQYLPIVSR